MSMIIYLAEGPTMGKLEVLTCFLISISSLSTIFSIRIDDDQMLQIEHFIKEKLEQEARTRRESVQTILKVLNELKKTNIHHNITTSQPPQTFEGKYSKTNHEDVKLNSLILALVKGFEAEKMNYRRIQRHVERNLRENRIEKTDVVHQIQAFDERIQHRLEELETSIKTNISNQIQKTDKRMQKHFGDFGVTLLDIINFQNTSKVKVQSDLHDIGSMLSDIKQSNKEMLVSVKKFESCMELQKAGLTSSGVYDIYPFKGATPLRVYCDQETDGGGWIVFQRREDGSENFYRKWIDYEIGFGNIEGEFWLGNKYLHLLTATCCHELRIDMEDFENERRYAKYSNFSIGSKSTHYVLNIGEYTGDAGNSFNYHNNQAFSTHDKDYDSWGANCAYTYKGAWWYRNCHLSHLNGQYFRGKYESDFGGVTWQAWRGSSYSLKMTEMKLR